MTSQDTAFPHEMQTLKDFQAFHRWLDEEKGFNTDVFLNMIYLSGEVGELAQVFGQVHWQLEPRRNGEEMVKTLAEALAEQRENLGQELADCLAYLLKLANYTGVDLQEAYLQKMAKNINRTWRVQQHSNSE